MGMFQHKNDHKSRDEQIESAIDEFFDDNLRDELREKSRLYFERVINENAALFKQDLDATVAHINTELRQHVARQLDDEFNGINHANDELKEHITKQFDEQFSEYVKSIDTTRDLALQNLEKSANSLQEQHLQLSASLQKSVANQDAIFNGMVASNKQHIDELTAAQDAAVKSLETSAKALEEQRTYIDAMLEKGIKDREDLLLGAFEQNMARIVEHYILQAVGDSYDLKSQLPSILKSLEQNKQTIRDDMQA